MHQTYVCTVAFRYECVVSVRVEIQLAAVRRQKRDRMCLCNCLSRIHCYLAIYSILIFYM